MNKKLIKAVLSRYKHYESRSRKADRLDKEELRKRAEALWIKDDATRRKTLKKYSDADYRNKKRKSLPKGYSDHEGSMRYKDYFVKKGWRTSDRAYFPRRPKRYLK